MSKVIVHVGQMKSGTTYVQEILSKNRVGLLQQNIVYPGGWLNQQPAVYGICGSSVPWVKDKKPYQAKADKLRDEIRDAKDKGHDVLLSAEALSSCDEEGIESFLDFIGGADRVIFSVRSLHKTLPSAWQQILKTGSYISIMEFFQQMDNTWNEKSGRWQTYAYGECIKRWSKFLPINTYVLPNKIITPKDPWNLFCSAAGLSDISDAIYPAKEENTSFSKESSDIIRVLSKNAYERGLDSFKVAVWYFDKFITGSKFKGGKIKPPIDFLEKVSFWSRDQTDLLNSLSDFVFGDVGFLTELDENLYEEFEDMAFLNDALLAQYVEHVISCYIKCN